LINLAACRNIYLNLDAKAKAVQVITVASRLPDGQG
jgi:hypothetical protein